MHSDKPSPRHPAPRTGVLAAHGGSGSTTVSRVLQIPEVTGPGAQDLDVLVITALTHAYGARTVIQTVASLPADPLIVLALTSTGWWTSPETRAMRGLLRDSLDGVVVLPWCWRWHDTAPTATTASRAWRAAALDLTALVDTLTHEGVPA